MTRAISSSEIVTFKPGATYLAAAAQIAAGIWMFSEPSTWSVGLLEIALGVAIVTLARRRQVAPLWIVGVVPTLVGGLFVFSAGLVVVLPGIVVVVAIAIDVLIGRLRG